MTWGQKLSVTPSRGESTGWFTHSILQNVLRLGFISLKRRVRFSRVAEK